MVGSRRFGAPPKRRLKGAPPKRRAKAGERFQIGIRVTPDLKDRLDAAAERSGRSQSQEAELRLERSFDRNALLPEVLSLSFGPGPAGILLLLAIVMEDAGNFYMDATRKVPYATDMSWSEHPDGFDCTLLAVVNLLIGLRPATASGDVRKRDWHTIMSIAHSTADTLLRDIRGDDVSPSTGAPSWCNADTIRALLGAAFATRLKSRPGVDEAKQALRLISASLRGSLSEEED